MMVKILVDKGVRGDLSDGFCESPIQIACLRGCAPIVRHILSHASTSKDSFALREALLDACKGNSVEVLYTHGVDLSGDQ